MSQLIAPVMCFSKTSKKLIQ